MINEKHFNGFSERQAINVSHYLVIYRYMDYRQFSAGGEFLDA